MKNEQFSLTGGFGGDFLKTIVCEKCGIAVEYKTKGKRHYCDSCRDMVAHKQKRAERKRWFQRPAGISLRHRLHIKRKKTETWAIAKKRQKERVRLELRDVYIKTLITTQTGLSPSLIPQYLIEKKREQLKIHRLYKRARKEIAA